MSRNNSTSLWVIIGVLCGVAACASAQTTVPCTDFTIQDVMPVYPPIARSAHIEGTVKLQVTIDANRLANIELVAGTRFIAGAAEDFISSRRYAWNSASLVLPCEYTTEVEYRMIPGESDERNDFLRVTTLGVGHTLIEVQLIKPTCNDCSDLRCPLDNAAASKPLAYPPIAKAAHVSGDVTTTVTFDHSGNPTTFSRWTGPEMLRKSAEAYLRSMKISELPAYATSCDANIFIEYRLTTDKDTVNGPVVTKGDPSHYLVEAAPAILSDPAGEFVTRRRKFLGIF
jgi:hypothetical protein